jgi:hypothetical protein
MINTLLIALGIAAFILTPKNKKCPNCKEFVNKHERQCDYCHSDLPMAK